MTIRHNFSEADFQNYITMTGKSSALKFNGVVELAAALYVSFGLIFLGSYLDLSFWNYIALIAYVVGLMTLILVALRYHIATQRKKSQKILLGEREYSISDRVLEIKIDDILQTIVLEKIERVESNERGSLIYLIKNGPMYLPFGTAFKSEFVNRLQDRIKQKG